MKSFYFLILQQCENDIKAELGRILDLDDLLINPIQRIPVSLFLLLIFPEIPPLVIRAAKMHAKRSFRLQVTRTSNCKNEESCRESK